MVDVTESQEKSDRPEVVERFRDEMEAVKESEETDMEKEEFSKLHSLIPYLTSKSVSQLDIVLEAITYINMLQNKLVH